MLQLNTILGFQHQASTRSRLQTFKICLENEPRVGTPIIEICMHLLVKVRSTDAEPHQRDLQCIQKVQNKLVMFLNNAKLSDLF